MSIVLLKRFCNSDCANYLFNLLINFKSLGFSSELAELAVCLQRFDEYSFLCISMLRLYSLLQYHWLSDRTLSASSADTLCPLLDWGLFNQKFHFSFLFFVLFDDTDDVLRLRWQETVIDGNANVI